MKRIVLAVLSVVAISSIAFYAERVLADEPTSDIAAWWTGPTTLGTTPPSDSTASIQYGELPTYPGFFGILIQGGADQSIEFPNDYVVALTFDNEYSIIREAVPITDPTATQSIIQTNEYTHRLEVSNDGRTFQAVPITSSDTSAADVTSSSTSFVTALTVALEVGTYHCHAHGVAADSTAVDGVQIRFNTSGLTASSASQASGQLVTATPAVAILPFAATNASSVVLSAAVFDTGFVDLDATIVVTVAGNVTLDVAQADHSTGTATLAAGADLRCTM